jgi:RNA processing factor Prp31
LSVDIENEIIIIHNFIRDEYRLKFPELESLVHHPIDYARVVKKIGNEMDLNTCRSGRAFTFCNYNGCLSDSINNKWKASF